uniref:C2H2-type domain-containing protein n=1 Tax=Strongyloides papillosus TaxID=174720 RepID=A0A0N5C8E5_STREA
MMINGNSIYQLPGDGGYRRVKNEFTSPTPIKKAKFDRELSKENDENINRFDDSPEISSSIVVSENSVNNFALLNKNTATAKVASKRQKTTRRRRFSFNVSTIRARKDTMTIEELQDCLDRKLEERLLRSVPVELINKTHAKCLICESIISLNRKFEIVHVVRHFLSWHKTNHICTRAWPGLEGQLCTKSNAYLKFLHECPEGREFFTGNEISFIPKDYDGDVVKKVTARDKYSKPLYAPNKSSFNVECKLCGIVMEHRDVSTHFLTCHSGDVSTPRCNLCTQEVLINAEFKFLYGKDYQISIVDEESIMSITLDKSFKGIDELYNVLSTSDIDEPMCGDNGASDKTMSAEGAQDNDTLRIEGSNNPRNLGKSAKPKRVFVHPRYRQAIPENSRFVEELAVNQWRCKLCDRTIIGAVISSAATKHFKKYHYEDSTYFDEKTNKEKYNPKSIFYQFSMELCDARLIRCSKGNVRMIDENTIFCKQCNGNYMNLHKAFNICRGVRHLKLKHPELMPEHNEPVYRERSDSGDSCGVEENNEILVSENLSFVSKVEEECLTDFQTSTFNSVDLLSDADNAVPPTTYVCNDESGNTIFNNVISYSGAHDNYVSNDFVDCVSNSSLIGGGVLLAPEIREEYLYNSQVSNYDLTGLPYIPNNSLFPVEYDYGNMLEDTSFNYTIPLDEIYDNSTSNNFPDYSSTSPYRLSGLNSMEYSDGYSPSSLLSQEMVGIQVDDGSADFFTKVNYKKYPISKEAIDSILKMRDIDGRECYILMTESDEFNHDIAFKIFHKNYSKI